VWQRRQPPPQQATTGPALIEGVERTNAVVVREQEQGMGISPRRNHYAIEVDYGRNCYAYGSFGHMARNCRNWRRGRVTEGRIEGINEQLNNLKEMENLESLD